MSLTTCRGCGQPLQAGVTVCGVCGVRVPDAEPATVGAEHAVPSDIAAVQPVATVVETEPVAAAAATVPIPPVAVSAPASAVDPEAARALVEETYARLAASQNLRAAKRRKVGVAAAIAIALGLLSRVAVGAILPSTPPPDQGELVAQLPIDADGGSAKFGDGGKIEVPKGAVDKPQTINVYKRPINQRVRLTSPSGGAPIVYPAGTLIVYEFGPTTLVFLRPVVIVLPIPAGQDGVVFVAANGAIRFLPGVGTGRVVRLVVNGLDFNRPGAVIVRG